MSKLEAHINFNIDKNKYKEKFEQILVEIIELSRNVLVDHHLQFGG